MLIDFETGSTGCRWVEEAVGLLQDRLLNERTGTNLMVN
jgi:hypothetical protein